MATGGDAEKVSRQLIFLPGIAHDLVEAFHYYETLSPGRGGNRLETAFKVAVQEVEDGLITHTRHFEHYHRVFLPRFPYNLYYRLSGNRAVLVGLLYARFHPDKIERTLKQRST